MQGGSLIGKAVGSNPTVPGSLPGRPAKFKLYGVSKCVLQGMVATPLRRFDSFAPYHAPVAQLDSEQLPSKQKVASSSLAGSSNLKASRGEKDIISDYELLVASSSLAGKTIL